MTERFPLKVYHYWNGNFEDGFRQSIGLFKDLFGDNLE